MDLIEFKFGGTPLYVHNVTHITRIRNVLHIKADKKEDSLHSTASSLANALRTSMDLIEDQWTLVSARSPRRRRVTLFHGKGSNGIT